MPSPACRRSARSRTPRTLSPLCGPAARSAASAGIDANRPACLTHGPVRGIAATDVSDAPTTNDIRRAGHNPPASARRRLSLRSGVLSGTVRPIRMAADERFARLARPSAVDTATLGLGGRRALVSATLRLAHRATLLSAAPGPAPHPAIGV